MDKINYNDIDFSLLKKSEIQGTTSTVYENGDECIKIINGLFPYEKRDLYKKFLEMDGIKINGVLLPTGLIIKDNNLYGYTMNNFKNSINLNDYFDKKIDYAILFDIVRRASVILKEIHNNQIIYEDLSFDNILIDDSFNIMFSDIDGCAYKDYSSPFISYILNNYISNYRGEDIHISKNLDRISMMLSMIYLVYKEEIKYLDVNYCEYISKDIKTLQNLKKYVELFKCTKSDISDIPYLDEIIDVSDCIDFNKTLNLSKI